MDYLRLASCLLVQALISSTLAIAEGQNEDEPSQEAVHRSPLAKFMLKKQQGYKEMLQSVMRILGEGPAEVRNKDVVQERDHGVSAREEEVQKGLHTNENLFEGDIMLAGDDIAPFKEDDAQTQKVSSTGRRWPNGIIPYEIDNIFHSRERHIILQAIREYEEKTCLHFREARNGQRLFITSKEGCSSYIGQKPNMIRQTISLGRGCVHHGIVVHELGHALGLWHEQSRPDRDRYVIIHRENITPGYESQFGVRRDADYHGEPYDFGSVMHYRSTAFSQQNGRHTISIRDQLLYELQNIPYIGQRVALSEIDARQINKHYGCYVPNSRPGTLTVRVPEAGPFQEPGNYYVCVQANESNSDQQRLQQCSSVDGMFTTNPSWNEQFVFKPSNHGTRLRRFYSFEITVRKRETRVRDTVVVNRQTIWVEADKYQGSFCVTKALCVPYNYKIN